MKFLPAALLVVLLVAACSPTGGDPASEAVPAVSERSVLKGEDGATEGVLAQKALYLSGIVPPDATAPIADQTRAAMERLGGTLDRAGLGFGNVVSCHVHLGDMDNYAEMNAVYGSFFEEGAYPARTTVEVPGLPGGAGVLLMCVAHSNGEEISVVRPAPGETPPAMGPYSPGVRAGRTLYLSGQGGRDPATGELADSSGGQARSTLETIGAILSAGGLSFQNAALASAYTPPAASEDQVAEAFGGRFSPGGAPSLVPVALSRLPGDILVEITFIAVEDAYINRLFMHDQVPTAMSSPASLSGGVLYTSAMEGTGDTFRQQVIGALDTQASLLELASMGWEHVVRMTAYVGDVSMQGELVEVLAETLPDPLPATSVIQSHHTGATQVALDLIAVQ